MTHPPDVLNDDPLAGAVPYFARDFPPATAQPCNDCPWRRAAAPGWLGPYTAAEWLTCAHGESAIACHQTIPDGGGWGPKTRQCRGAASFRAHVGKLPMNATIEVGPSDPDVFTSNYEFVDHHDA